MSHRRLRWECNGQTTTIGTFAAAHLALLVVLLEGGEGRHDAGGHLQGRRRGQGEDLRSWQRRCTRVHQKGNATDHQPASPAGPPPLLPSAILSFLFRLKFYCNGTSGTEPCASPGGSACPPAAPCPPGTHSRCRQLQERKEGGQAGPLVKKIAHRENRCRTQTHTPISASEKMKAAWLNAAFSSWYLSANQHLAHPRGS